MLQQRLYSNSAAWRNGYIFIVSALRRTVLEDLPGSVHKLSVSHLPWAADLLWFYFPLGFLAPPLRDLHAATVCVPYACHRTTHKGHGPKAPTLAVALGMGLALQFAESRKRGPAASCWASVCCKSFIYLWPQLPVSADQAARHLNSMASLNHLINQLAIRLFPHE